MSLGFLAKARRFFIAFGGLYVLLIILLTIPSIQRHLVFCHSLRFPLFAQYDVPEKYTLAPFKTLDVRIPTPDNETLGAWFTVSDRFYTAQAIHSPLTDADIHAALLAHPTILFFHGNAGTRALSARVAHYKDFAARLHSNVLAIDYRGFGDSTGVPSEEGLEIDARAAWDWLIARGAVQSDVLVVGNSLGTAVSVNLVSGLEKDGLQPRGVVLLAPFSTVSTLMDTYYILGLIPLLAPLRTIPFAAEYLKRFLLHRFDSLSKVTAFKTPLLIVHAEDDWDIPFAHSETIFDAFLEPYLPAMPTLSVGKEIPSPELLQEMSVVSKQRDEHRSQLVEVTELERLGRQQVFTPSVTGGKVVFLKTAWGAHDRIGLVQGVQDLIANLYDLH
ncbi:alpha/beta-hydrolase [Artomyces pyxidatus]|uniref:Alpha/beta-hydrolase n=1 Tax=Artomyces pyxidatus TaxID=48021 RepID=A0ACB8SJ37_9AGAM|nr:alpha/beta-hydrolase [Artomyces pyxidatus]